MIISHPTQLFSFPENNYTTIVRPRKKGSVVVNARRQSSVARLGRPSLFGVAKYLNFVG